MKFKVWVAVCKWSTVHMVMMRLTHFCVTEIYAHDICLAGRRFTFGNNTSELYNSCGNPTPYMSSLTGGSLYISSEVPKKK